MGVQKMRVSKNDVVQKMIGFRKLGVQNMKGLENNFRNEGAEKEGFRTRGVQKKDRFRQWGFRN